MDPRGPVATEPPPPESPDVVELPPSWSKPVVPVDATVVAESSRTNGAVLADRVSNYLGSMRAKRAQDGMHVADSELAALFFSFDGDSNGYLDRQELVDALDKLGYPLTTEHASALFDRHCTTSVGAAEVDGVKVDGFKVIVSTLGGIRPEPGLKDAMDLFAKYDEDDSGFIDKEEFKSLAREIKTTSDRRKVLQIASAVVGSLVVARSSDEYQWAQKTFRPLYIENRAEESQAKIFPTAMLSSDVDAAIAKTLEKRGFNARNTLFAHSVCSDEVNHQAEQLTDLMVDRWGEGFALGGLAGLPFAGKSGFRAYLHHVPDNGKLLVMFAPHVGIDGEGRIGALQRVGQNAVSKACGAAIGAFKAIGVQTATRLDNLNGNVLSIPERGGVRTNLPFAFPRSARAPSDCRAQRMPCRAPCGTRVACTRRSLVRAACSRATQDNEEFDPQIQQIVKLLKPKIEGIEDSANDIGFVTYQMYGIVRDLLDSCINETPDVWEWTNEVAIVSTATLGPCPPPAVPRAHQVMDPCVPRAPRALQVGGIIINRKNGGDFSQPLSLESRTQNARPTNLYEETFGKRPDLLPILGSNSVAAQVYGPEKLASLSRSLRGQVPSL